MVLVSNMHQETKAAGRKPAGSSNVAVTGGEHSCRPDGLRRVASCRRLLRWVQAGLVCLFLLTGAAATSAQQPVPQMNQASSRNLPSASADRYGFPPSLAEEPSFGDPALPEVRIHESDPVPAGHEFVPVHGQTCWDEGWGLRHFQGVDGQTCPRRDGEPQWRDSQMIPWEAFAWGEYVGPCRTPAVPQYRVRVDDQLEFVFMLTREQTAAPYRLTVGDTIDVFSTADNELNQTEVKILSDGSISLRLVGRVMAARKTIEELQAELNERYQKYFSVDPAIVVRGTSTDIRLQDLLNAVDSRFNTGGTSKLATVAPDGTVQLPLAGSIPAVGLTLEELRREVNMRYQHILSGFDVTPILVERAPTFVYVLGEVRQPGRVQLTGPTSAMQAVALAGGWNAGGNLRQIVVFRRDENWNLMALRLDLAGGLHGQRPTPSDEIWLRDSDIVLVPKMPIQRLADAVDLYFTRTIYGIFPTQFFLDGLSGVSQ